MEDKDKVLAHLCVLVLIMGWGTREYTTAFRSDLVLNAVCLVHLVTRDLHCKQPFPLFLCRPHSRVWPLNDDGFIGRKGAG